MSVSLVLLMAVVGLFGCRKNENQESKPSQPAPTAVLPAAEDPAPPPASKPAEEKETPTARPESKVLYLTFDADMTPGMLEREKQHRVERWYSPGLVDYLLENHIEATVFSTGMFAEDYPELMQRLATSGLISIQNHTYDHAAFSNPCYGLPTVTGDEAKLQEMSKASAALERITGQTPTWLRHPGLCHQPHDVELATQSGMKLSDTGTISGDAFAHNAKLVAAAIVQGAPHNPIIIMHLGGPNAPVTEQAVRMAVPQLQAKGYTFSRLQ